MISICIASYNAEKSIRLTLNSILNQTYQDFEVIIVDDHSTDDTVKIIAEYSAKDPRIKLITNLTEKKYQDAHNLSYQLAKGDILFRVDSDDILMADYIEYHVKFLEEHPDIDAFSTKMLRMHYNNEIGSLFPKDESDDTSWLISQSEEERNFFNEHPEISWIGNTMIWSNPSSSLRKSFYDKHKPEFISYGMGDYVFWWNVISKGAKLYKDNVIKSYHCFYNTSGAADDSFYFMTFDVILKLYEYKIEANILHGNMELVDNLKKELQDFKIKHNLV